MSARRAAAALAGLLASLAVAPDLSACTPSAETVVAWDMSKDLVVVGVWPGRERPPPNEGKPPPGAFELRRISTGERIALRDCGNQFPCDYRKILAHELPADVRLNESRAPLPGAVRVKETRTGDQFELAFEFMGYTHREWRRVLWLEVMPAAEAAQERRMASTGGLDFHDGDAMVIFQVRATGGNCSYTFVRVVRMPRADLENPRRPGRQAELLKRPARKDAPFEYWRTVAELGPLPADRLIEAMEAAAHDAQVGFAVRWWRDATRGLSRQHVAKLAETIKKSAALSSTRRQLGL